MKVFQFINFALALTFFHQHNCFSHNQQLTRNIWSSVLRRTDGPRKVLSSPFIKVKKRRVKALKRRPVFNHQLNFTNDLGQEIDAKRDSRFFSLFTIVRFRNEICATDSGGNGTCYTKLDCADKGGLANGVCAGGFGVCCQFEYQCGSSTAENGTYFSNPVTPTRVCNLIINRVNDDICQVKLHFDMFDLAPPDSKGFCATDYFLATGGSQVPQICGLNTGQHVIYSITPSSGPSQLSVIMDTGVTSTASRQWQIRIFQYECSSPVLAPNGCLQYHMESSGRMQSFNYKTDVTSTLPNHLANLNYAICIRIESGFCGIRYSQVDNFSFTLSGAGAPITDKTAFVATDVMYGDSLCKTDYLVIAGGSETGTNADMLYAKDRFCGVVLGYCKSTATVGTCTAAVGAVTTFTKPFVVGVITDGTEEAASSGNRGFNLVYNQQPCLASG